MQVDRRYFVVFQDVICGVGGKQIEIKPLVNFVIPIFGVLTESMEGNIQPFNLPLK